MPPRTLLRGVPEGQIRSTSRPFQLAKISRTTPAIRYLNRGTTSNAMYSTMNSWPSGRLRAALQVAELDP